MNRPGLFLTVGFLGFAGFKSVTFFSALKPAFAQETKTPPQAETERDDTQEENVFSSQIEEEEKYALSNQAKKKESIITDADKVCITRPLLKAAIEKQEYLLKLEKRVNAKAALLEVADRRVREQVAKLNLIKEDIAEKMRFANIHSEKEEKRLITIYEKMRPKDAAAIFDEMAANVAAELLRTMKEDKSSAILAKMNPKAAYAVTMALAKGPGKK